MLRLSHGHSQQEMDLGACYQWGQLVAVLQQNATAAVKEQLVCGPNCQKLNLQECARIMQSMSTAVVQQAARITISGRFASAWCVCAISDMDKQGVWIFFRLGWWEQVVLLQRRETDARWHVGFHLNESCSAVETPAKNDPWQKLSHLD